MNSPTITLFRTHERFSYLWLKYVNDFNLNEHCAKSLIGEYSKLFGSNVVLLQDAELNEYEAKYYYLCGVTSPYVWRNNFHLPFRYKEGATLVYDFNETHIEIENAEKINIYRLPVYEHRYGANKAYNTCRNWQFAYQVANGLIQ